MRRCHFCNSVMNLNSSSIGADEWSCPTCETHYLGSYIEKGPNPERLRWKAENLEALADVFEKKRGNETPVELLVRMAEGNLDE